MRLKPRDATEDPVRKVSWGWQFTSGQCEA